MMAKVTQHQMDQTEASIIDVYQHLEQQLFEDFIKRLQQHGIEDVDNTSILQWQMEVMNDLHLVNSDVISETSKATGIARAKLVELFRQQGYKVVDQEYTRATEAAGKQVSAMQVNMTKQVLDGYLKQTFLELDNNVNQTLLSTNYGTNAATQTFQQIVKDTTADVLAGLRTPDQALKSTIYRWRDKGIDLGLVDKGGHRWSLESYARLVVDNTTRRAFQAVRDQAADDVGVDTFVMSSHEASRAACASIQGKLVTTRAESFTDANTGEHFISLYDHGYGTPSGTFGINCHHLKWLYVPGASSNNQPQYDPAEAIAKGDMVAKQRELERRIRAYKQKQALADKMNDADGIARSQLLIRRNQAALRKLVSDHSYLHRDYTREKVFARPE